MKVRHFIACISVVTALAGCGSSNTTAIPEPTIPEPPAQPEQPTEPVEFSMTILDTALEGETINRLISLRHSQEQMVVAATNNGLYLKAGERWSLISQESWEILDFYELNNEHWIASVRDNGVNHLVESLDGGERWGIIDNNFGGSAEMSSSTQEPLYRLAADENAERLYAIGIGVLAESLDFGVTWQAIAGFWGSFGSGLDSLTYVSNNPEEGASRTLFYGGQGAIENPILNRFDVTEANTDALSVGEETLIDVSDETLLPVPSVVKSIVPYSNEPGSFLVTGEGGVIATQDNGASWQPVLTNETSRFYFDILVHPNDSNLWVTAGWNKDFDNPQAFIVELTRDGGENWESVSYEGEDGRGIFGGIYSMSWASPGENTVYFGSLNGGVYTVQLQL